MVLAATELRIRTSIGVALLEPRRALHLNTGLLLLACHRLPFPSPSLGIAFFFLCLLLFLFPSNRERLVTNLLAPLKSHQLDSISNGISWIVLVPLLWLRCGLSLKIGLALGTAEGCVPDGDLKPLLGLYSRTEIPEYLPVSLREARMHKQHSVKFIYRP